jgi:flagellar hook-associated protein 1
MSISSIFNSASTSLAAQRAALDVTSENISNVNTEGYSRQRVIMETGPTITKNGLPVGGGVYVASVQRIYDDVLNKQINDGTSLQGNNDAKLQTLQQVEPYLNEISGNSIGDAMQGLSDSWQSLSLNPAGISERQTVLGKAQILVDTFHQVSDGITNAQNFTDQSLTAVATDVTAKAKEIADLNTQIRMTEMANGNANELRDRRDLLIQNLSKQVGVSYTEQSDGMKVTLLGGETLVSGAQYATLYTNKVGPGVTNNELRITAAGAPPPATNPAGDVNVTSTIGGSNNSKGAIGGLLYARDTAMPAYLGKLDELAYNLSYQINTQHAAGWNLNNTTGQAFFSTAAGSTTPPALPADYAGYSSSIALAKKSSNPLVDIDTNDIAAADTNPLTGGIGNNKNALLLAGVANTQVAFSGGVMSTTANFYNSLVANIGVDVQGSKNLSAQNDAFVRQLNNLRASNSGVSLDEELTNLIKYQKAFEGASKVISTASQMMDTLLGLIR